MLADDSEEAVPVARAPVGLKAIVGTSPCLREVREVATAAVLDGGTTEDASEVNSVIASDEGAGEFDVVVVSGVVVSSAGSFVEIVDVVGAGVVWLDCTPVIAFQFAGDTAENVSSVSVPLHLFQKSTCQRAIESSVD